MSVALKILKKTGERSDVVASRSWPQSRITIGRGDECTLVLEDPKKYVSRVHVELEQKNEGSFGVTVVSKVNPIFVGGKRQAPGSRVELSTGDRFAVGEYEIELLPTPGETATSATTVPEAEETTRPGSPPPQAPPVAPVTAAAPLAAVEDAELEAAILSGELPPVEAGLFDDATPEVEPAQKEIEPPQIPVEPPAPAANVFEEATFIGKALTAEAGVFDAPGPSAVPAAPETNVFEEATYVGAAAAPATSVYDEATYVGGRPPAHATAPPGAPAPSSAQASGPALQRAIKAFLEGAGIPGQAVPDAQVEEFLRQSGTLMRAAVEGVMTLLAARATTKKELRAEERTMVAARDNNPLKLMSDPQEAMDFLFDVKEKSGGFLNPVQAVSDAFDDLRVHEVALIAGMRAALLGTIQRFDPKTLEAELEKAAGGLGLNRKAKLWELFAAYQEKLARDAGDDFNKVFGREFMGTYMAQVKRLRGEH